MTGKRQSKYNCKNNKKMMKHKRSVSSRVFSRRGSCARSRSQVWNKLEKAAKNIGEGVYDATRVAGGAIAKGTITAGTYIATAVKKDMAYHSAIKNKRKMRIAFAKRNGLRIDPNNDDVYYTRNGEVVVVDVTNPNEVATFEREYRGHIRSRGYGYGSPRQVIILR